MSENSELLNLITKTTAYQDYSTVHRPERTLYYLNDTTDDDIDRFFRGELPAVFKDRKGQYGSYDSPGLYTLNNNKRVLGIELRPNDPDIDYPAKLDTLSMEACDLLYCDFCYDFIPSTEDVREIFLSSKKWFEEFERGKIEEKEAEFRYVTYAESKRTRIILPIIDNSYKFEITTSYKNMTKEELLERIIRDPMMTTPNWSYMFEKLSHSRDEGIKDYVYAYFDIKRFKMLKEIHNSAIAVQFMNRIGKAMEECEWIYYGCRCDNDNFAMMVKDMPHDVLEKKLREFFDSLSRLEDNPSYRVYFRCGVVDMRTSLNTCMGVTDYAKIAHKMCDQEVNATEICYYTDEMWENDLWGKKIRNYLPTAIENDEFILHFQPKYEIGTERIIGAEALVRWNYQKKELLFPNSFISYFEVDNSISVLDDLVLNKVCAIIRGWKEKGYKLLPVSVNLSQKQVEQADLAEHLQEIVDNYGIDHDLIEFELTERIAYSNQEYMLNVMKDIKSRGFLISMDDFGTGFSSLNLLAEMPLDTLKIDKSFVDHLAEEIVDEKNLVVVRHIITMAKDLKVMCLAEGAEERIQIDALKKLGCDFVQGYYYSKPIPVADFEALNFA
ncbi:MAG: EAL domain-containing protein [Lachnospiraceae bacterium]|nr:EAL domain-containing protein [Lachnospiraceae bacterium]